MYSVTAPSAARDFWLADDSPDFGFLDPIDGLSERRAPIRLQRGDRMFGAAHIEQRHGVWLRRLRLNAPQLVWRKCRQRGTVYRTEDVAKGKIELPLHPSALMVLQYRNEGFWTVVTLYYHEGKLDGEVLGKYVDSLNVSNTQPTFSIKETATTVISTKRSRPANDQNGT